MPRRRSRGSRNQSVRQANSWLRTWWPHLPGQGWVRSATAHHRVVGFAGVGVVARGFLVEVDALAARGLYRVLGFGRPVGGVAGFLRLVGAGVVVAFAVVAGGQEAPVAAVACVLPAQVDWIAV